MQDFLFEISSSFLADKHIGESKVQKYNVKAKQKQPVLRDAAFIALLMMICSCVWLKVLLILEISPLGIKVVRIYFH